MTKSQPLSSKTKGTEHKNTLSQPLAKTILRKLNNCMHVGAQSKYLNSTTPSLRIPKSPPAPDSACPPGVPVQIYFYFHTTTSIRVLTYMLDTARASASYHWMFPAHSKLSHISIVILLVHVVSKQGKKVHIIRVDEYGDLSQSSEFLEVMFHNSNEGCSIAACIEVGRR